MLEHRVLLLQPRTVSGVQPILDGDSGVPLGSARWQTTASRLWGRLLRRTIVAVHEHEDEPLLFTLRRACSLWPRRELFDAEGHFVGSLLGRFIYNCHGRTIAALQGEVFRSPAQHALAEWTTCAAGRRLTFSPDIGGEPFLKMLLLAAALTGEPTP